MSKPFVPTDEQRENVKTLMGFGLRESDVCLLIKNPETGRPISEDTLRRCFSTLEKVADGDIDRLMITMPPGSAKTTYASKLFPPYFMRRGNVDVTASGTPTSPACDGQGVGRLRLRLIATLGSMLPRLITVKQDQVKMDP
jgi:hypothetical protein